jgi:hypothetical protein
VENGRPEVVTVTQKSVEIVIGKLASDAELRGRFRRDRLAAIRSLQEQGLELSPVEVASLVSLEADAVDALARALDPRLQKVPLKPVPGDPGQGAKESA